MPKRRPIKPIAHAIVAKRWGAFFPSEKIYPVIKQWKDPNGNSWVKLHAGFNLSGQALIGGIPESSVKFVKAGENNEESV